MKRSRGDSEMSISTKIAKSDQVQPSLDCIDLTLDSDDPGDLEEPIQNDGQDIYHISEPEELDEDPFKHLPLPPEPPESSKYSKPKTAVRRPPPPLIKIKFSHVPKNQTNSNPLPDGVSSQSGSHLEAKPPTAAIQRHLEGSGHQIGLKKKESKPRGRPPKNAKDKGSIPVDIWEGETAIKCDEVTTMRVCPGNKPPFALCGILLAEAKRDSSIAYLPNTNSIRCQRCYFEIKIKGNVKAGRRGLASVGGVPLSEDNHFGGKVRVHLEGERHKRAVRIQQIRCGNLEGKWDPEVFDLSSGSDSE